MSNPFFFQLIFDFLHIFASFHAFLPQALGLRGDLGKEEVAFQQAGHVSSKG